MVIELPTNVPNASGKRKVLFFLLN